ncbi:MAG: hypothetical protein ACK47C_07585, partial [Paracoccaceae bacterium]
RYPLSYRDVRDMLAERGITVDAASIHRWVRKFGPEIRKRARSRHRAWRGLIWHVDETYIRVNGRLVLSLARGRSTWPVDRLTPDGAAGCQGC